MRNHSADWSGRRRSVQPLVRPTRRALLIGAAATAAGIAWPGSRSLRAAEANVGARDGENGDARAFLYDEDPAGPRVTRLAGSALWSATMESIGSDRSPDMVVGGEITIPGRGMTLRCVLRRNRDRWLPASHTIDLMFALPAHSPHGSVLSVVGILMKSEENARGVPLHALTVKVTSGYFVAALAVAEADRAAICSSCASVPGSTSRSSTTTADAPSWRSRRAPRASAPSATPSRHGTGRRRARPTRGSVHSFVDSGA